MSEAVDVGTSAASGAATGFAVAGPVGAVVGGILGAVGGLFKSKAKNNARRADAEEQKMVEREQAAQRRSIVRDLYLARQTALAAGAAETGGLASSTVQGGLGSIATQGLGNLNFFDAQIANMQARNTYLQRAAKASDISSGIGSLISAGATLYKGATNRGLASDNVTFSSLFNRGAQAQHVVPGT
jgi:hypothetical protein